MSIKNKESDAEPDKTPTVLTDKLVRPVPEVRPAPSPRDSQLEDALSGQITDLLDQMKSASPSGVVVLAQAVGILVKQKDLIEKADRLTDQQDSKIAWYYNRRRAEIKK